MSHDCGCVTWDDNLSKSFDVEVNLTWEHDNILNLYYADKGRKADGGLHIAKPYGTIVAQRRVCPFV